MNTHSFFFLPFKRFFFFILLFFLYLHELYKSNLSTILLGYANLKWLKAHVKAAHEKSEASKAIKAENEPVKEENKGRYQ